MISKMRKATQMTQKEFAAHFKMSIRTLQSWEAGYREPPDYVVYMMYTILKFEGYELEFDMM